MTALENNLEMWCDRLLVMNFEVNSFQNPASISESALTNTGSTHQEKGPSTARRVLYVCS